MSNSLLQSILEHDADKIKANFNPSEIMRDLVSGLEEKARTVISSRAGLGLDKKVTLSSIGEKFHLSRERIRQIERDVMNKLSDKLHEKYRSETQVVISSIDKEGGVISEAGLVSLLLPAEHQSITDVNSLRLFLRLTKDLIEIKESKTMRAGWVLKVVSKTTIDQSLLHLLEIIKEKGSVVDFSILWDNSEDLHKFPQSFLKHIISLSKEVIETTDHQYGLSTWPTVNPKNVRDKIYYVLNESGKPLHFTDIAKRIGGSGFDGKKIVQPTVHNELIADDRFVLVGRGIYALTQWGYTPGTVEEVIENVLKKAKRPMTTDEIVEEVLKSRQVKKNTIIINLQIKPQFVKVGRKLYSLSEVNKDSVTKEVKAVLKASEVR